MVTYIGSLVQLCCEEGGTLQTNITGTCEECLQCLGYRGFPLLTACVFSWSTLLRLQVTLQGNCQKWVLGCVHFPGLSHSGSDSWVSTKAQTGLGLSFVPFPGPSSSDYQVLGEHTLPRWVVCHITSPSQLLSFLGAQQEC